MSIASQLIERLIRETNSDSYEAFIELLHTNPIWFPKKATIDISKSTKKLIYCTLDNSFPISKSALDSFKSKIIEKAKEYFSNPSIVDNEDGFSILVG